MVTSPLILKTYKTYPMSSWLYWVMILRRKFVLWNSTSGYSVYSQKSFRIFALLLPLYEITIENKRNNDCKYTKEFLRIYEMVFQNYERNIYYVCQLSGTLVNSTFNGQFLIKHVIQWNALHPLLQLKLPYYLEVK